MTPEQQRIAIAEWCGWKWYRRPATGPWADKPMRAMYHPNLHAEYIATLKPADMTERECNPVFLWREGMIPDYLNDLNAIHEAEKRLDNENSLIPANEGYETQWDRYISTLEDVLFLVTAEDDIYKDCICSTAAQRAEALLKTIGKGGKVK